MTKSKFNTKQLVLAALCVALGVVLPVAFHSIPNAGSVLLLLLVYVGFISGTGPSRGLLGLPTQGGQNVRAAMLLTAASDAQIPYRLFATSALGAEPNAATIGRGGIVPFRVLDVLQAALTKKIGVR